MTSIHDVLDFVREQRAERAQKMALGAPKSFEEYREYVGFIQAMDAVETAIVDGMKSSYER